MDSWIQRGGPLAAFATDYREELEHLGYTGHSVVTHLVLVGQLNRWMASSGVTVEGLDRARIEDFLETRRAGGQQRVPSSGVFDQLLAHLRAKEVLRRPVVEPKTSLDELLDRYERHLIEGRGVARSTAVAYVGVARRFLAERAIGDDETALDGLRGDEVTTFLLRESDRLSVLTAKNRVTGLRSLLRFLRLEGLVATDLAAALPPVAGWRDTRLPTPSAGIDVAALVESCDRSRPVGLRDFAILLLLARLGLRSGEVAGLTLEDLDWQAGELLVRGKGGGADRLPLPTDVGEAVAEYVQRARPQVTSRAVFITLLAPIRPINPCSVAGAVTRACERTGQHPVGPHRLRHALATEMLRRGAALPEIGQVLRHRDLATTALYAKVDLVALRTVARPWPGASR